ncbi:NEL-type E3 ubiquitin ligase domain-containing protein [Pseudomonas akapageensis]|uniref:NEL-type E3 ubiquitin ligase domain-containing protein n=1 Tax=Pseudomonas akapageensis TaxID=2609961 RepID=UPI00140D36F0|nr:NEL-type E3 ubiquitin ligase domain-containing protein [Pseudomonas akapageensis]
MRDIHDETTSQALPTAIVTAEGVHDHFIRQHLPDWLRNASSAQRQQLRAAILRSQRSKAEVRKTLAGWQGLKAFAEPLLSNALQREFGQSPDLEHTNFVHLFRRSRAGTSSPGPVLKVLQSSLLQAALQNFASGETFAAGTGLRQGDGLLGIDAQAFARVCRELDLGRRYQQHLTTIFEPVSLPGEAPDAASSNLRASVMICQRDALAVQAELALLQGHIGQQAHDALLAGLNPHPGPGFRVFRLSLWGLALDEILLFEVQGADDDGVQPCLVYIPDDVNGALRHYPSRRAFIQALRGRLRKRTYQAWFGRFVGQRNRGAYLQKVEQLFNAVRLVSGQLVPVDPSHVRIDLDDTQIVGNVFRHCFDQHLARIRDDARVLAVPTADIDANERLQRLEQWLELGLNVVNTAALFVPVLGIVMMPVAAAQLLGAFFHGVESWEAGETDQALGYLMGVAQNLALLAALGGAQGVGESVLPAEGVGFTDHLETVKLPNGQRRLWKPDMTPYQQDVELAPYTANAQGQYVVGSRHYIRLQGKVYEQVYNTGLKQWQIRHPSDPQAYQPLLAHNGRGAWLLVHENPLSWDRPTLLRRIGHSVDTLTDAQLEQAFRISGIDEDALRQMHVDHQPVPPLLAETLRRLETGKAVDPLMTQPPASTEVMVLERDFPGLPRSILQSLVEQASGVERERMTDSARVPLRLAEEARAYLQPLRLNRAFEGLYVEDLNVADSDTLALRTLEQLPGWSKDVRLEVRQGSSAGQLLDEVGSRDAAMVRYLVKEGGGYRAYDDNGNSLNGLASTGNNLFPSILHALPDAQRQALGYGLDESQKLRQAVAELAVKDRGRAARALGQRATRPGFQVPTRLAAGRLGYPLSGRGAVTTRGVLLTRVSRLYPGFTATQAEEFLSTLGLSEAQAGQELLRREAEFATLSRDLDAWVQSPSWHTTSETHALRVSSQSKRQVADNILRCWQRQTERLHSGDGQFIGYQLDLSFHTLGPLPELTADLSHVASLSLTNMRLLRSPDAFLRHFPRLRWLNMANNKLTEFPQAISEMAGLTKLYLSHNQIRLTPQGLEQLRGMSGLKILALDFNPLGDVPDVSLMTDLRILTLRATGIERWPTGVFERPQPTLFTQLDLRDNRIQSLPQGILNPLPESAEAVTQVNRVTFLDGNPLSPESVQQLAEYLQRAGIAMGIIQARAPITAAAPVTLVARWLRDESAEQIELKSVIWADLVAEPGSADFFRILDTLGESGEFQGDGYADLKSRVWGMIDEVTGDTELRAILFKLSAQPQTCADGASLVFSQLEVRVLVYKATLAAGSAQEQALLSLAAGLYRLDEVERIALEDIAARIKAINEKTQLSARQREWEIDRLDQVEVRLAYRVGLREALDLPGQPSAVRFTRIANVSQAMLDAAKVTVLANEQTTAQFVSICQRDFWRKFLKKTYSERFEQVTQPFHERLAELDDVSQTMTSEHYLKSTEALDAQRKAEIQTLIEELTRKAMDEAVPEIEITEL